MAALVARLGASHRAAFFAPTVLLVEGPSDEIVVTALATRLDRSLAGAGTQIVLVIGKSEMPDTAWLFRLMGKDVLILADLDALADSNALVSAFANEERVREAAQGAGHMNLSAMDRPLRTALAQAVGDRWDEIKPLAAAHRYVADRGKTTPVDVARRRATLAALLSADEEALRSLPHGEVWLSLRRQFGALLDVLETGGCFVLRRGTIEDCYLDPAASAATGKPEAAAAEAVVVAEAAEAALRRSYADVLRVIERAAPASPVDENAFLRDYLAGLLGAVFQALKPDTTQDEIAAAALAANPEASRIFALENASAECHGAPALRVSITSPLFVRPTFSVVTSLGTSKWINC